MTSGKKKLWWIVGGVVALGLVTVVAASGGSTPPAQTATPVTDTQTQTEAAPAVTTPAAQSQQSPTPLSNDNSYVNVSGNTVHSPAYSENGSVPAGATAQCRDGTYSFSQHRSGTCSYHGGVAEWLQ
jgi:hypothetical protein